MNQLSALLDKVDLEGPAPLVRFLCPISNAARIPHCASAQTAIGRVCQWWGGGAQLLLPGGEEANQETIWQELLRDFDADGVWNPAHVPPSGQGPGIWGENLWVVLAEAAQRSDRPNVEVPEVSVLDPWGASYLACFGTLPTTPDTWMSWPRGIRTDLEFHELLDIEWVHPELPGPDDLIARLRGTSATPIGLSMWELGLTPARHYTMPQEDPPILPTRRPIAMSAGPNVAVVYEPGSIEDLCLLWNLRAAHAMPRGFPLGIPNTDSVVDDLKRLFDLGAARRLNLAPLQVALTGFSVSPEVLLAIAEQLGNPWIVAPPSDLIQAPAPASRLSRDVATFAQGAARVATWASSDQATLRYFGAGLNSVNLTARYELEGVSIPHIRSISGEAFDNRRYRHGGVEVSGGSSTAVASVYWPRGWTLLEGAARDRDLRVRASTPGLAAEALIRRSGGLEATGMFADPRVLVLLTKLCENTGVSFFRRRLRELSEKLSSTDDTNLLLEAAAHLQRARGDDDSDVRTVPYSTFVQSLGRQDAEAWLRWSERQGLILRGATLKCKTCEVAKWYRLSELATAIHCRTCSAVLKDPYEPSSLQFQYRAGETLLETFEYDAMSHVLTLRWLFALFGGFESRSRIYGVYPGVTFCELNGEELPEVDAVILMADGALVVGECKRPQGQLSDKDLDNLEKVAKRLSSPWTFVATPTEQGALPSSWGSAVRRVDPPRFVLTADQLFDIPAVWLAGRDPFRPPAEDDDLPRRMTPSQLAYGTDLAGDPDRWLFTHLDSQNDN